MSHIVININSYKSKGLLECVESIYNNSSGLNTFEIHILDRNNLDRQKYFYNTNYQYMIWDKQVSKFTVREEVARTSQGDYFLTMDQSAVFCQDWDKELIKMQQGSDILSGNYLIKFKKEYKFFTEYEESENFEKYLTNFISPRFIFARLSDFNLLPSLSKLKHLGESEVLSVFLNDRDVNIYSVPSYIFNFLDSDIKSYDYLPFSISHNYNLILDMVKGKNNIFFDKKVDMGKISKRIGYDFSQLSYHPFQQNDIEYSTETSIDEMSGTRFFGGVRSIY